MGLRCFGLIFFLIVGITSSYSSADVPTLPCDLNKLSFTPALALHGENHDNPNSQMSQMMDMLEASRGNFFLGLEGYFYEYPAELNRFLDMLVLKNSSNRIFGFDSAFTHGIGALYSLHLSATKVMIDRRENAKPESELRSRMNYLASIFYFQYNMNPFLREALAELGDYSVNPIAPMIIRSSSRETVNVYSNAAIAPFLVENHFRNLMGAMALSFTSMAIGPKYANTMGAPSDLPQLTMMSLSGTDLLTPIQKVAVEWRNRQIITNMAQIYCRAAQEKKNVVLVMGLSHVPGIKQMFESMTRRKAKITVLDTTIPRPLTAIGD